MMPVRLSSSLSTLHYAAIPIQYTTHDPLLYKPLQGKQLFFGKYFNIFHYLLKPSISGKNRSFTHHALLFPQQKPLQSSAIEAK